MINVIVVPETDKYKFDVSHDSVVYINPELGEPNLEGRNAKYLAPYWIAEQCVNRIFHIVGIEENEITLGNSFVLDENWDKMEQHRRFEYHSLESFDLVEIKDGILISYKFNKG
ncbi:MAG: hypothetical protein ABR968_14370 [Bacteroidales bacterium]|jgi:hypothetical protein